MSRAKNQRSARAITAQATGSRFFVESRGLRHAQHKRRPGDHPILDELEECSDNSIMGGEGTYRAMPTCGD